MKYALLIFVVLYSLHTFAQDFTNVNVSTTNFTSKEASGWTSRQTPSHCRVDIQLNEETGMLKFRMGIVGSVFDAFGWNMEMPVSALPLASNYEQVVAVPGNTTMIISYDGKTLTFKRDKNDKVWNTMYPFSLVVDANLQNPKSFKGIIEGYQRGPFGLKQHVKQECKF